MFQANTQLQATVCVSGEEYCSVNQKKVCICMCVCVRAQVCVLGEIRWDKYILFSKFPSVRALCNYPFHRQQITCAHTSRPFTNHSCFFIPFSSHIIKLECSLNCPTHATIPTPLPAPCNPWCFVAHLQQIPIADMS